MKSWIIYTEVIYYLFIQIVTVSDRYIRRSCSRMNAAEDDALPQSLCDV